VNEQNILDLAILLLDAASLQEKLGEGEKSTESREIARMLINGLEF
jgi:hypothetical protein